jgi:hypothetical protein
MPGANVSNVSYRDAPRRLVLPWWLRDPNLQHAVRKCGVDPFGIDLIRQPKASVEAPAVALEPIEVLLALLTLGAGLATDYEAVAFELNLDVNLY